MALRREFTEARIRDTWEREKSRADISRGRVWQAYLDEGYSVFEHPPRTFEKPDDKIYTASFRREGDDVIGWIEGTGISIRL